MGGDKMYHIGIDLGGTNIKVGIVDNMYNLVTSANCKTALPRSAEAVCDDIVFTIYNTLEKASIAFSQIKDIGIGCPGSVNTTTGIVKYSCNLDWHDFSLQKYISQKFNDKLPVYIANDANAAALGEYFAGSAKGTKSAVVITLGTGIGAGVIIDGKILTGSYYCGAEIGHMVIEHRGKPCTCGRLGCWETYASAVGLINLTKDKMRISPNSLMWKIAGDIDGVRGTTAFKAKAQYDEGGTCVVEQYIEYLACGITNIVNILQPDVISIGGGVSREGDNLIVPLREIVMRNAYGSPTSNTELRICTLGNNAGMIGSALLGENASLN